MLLLITYDVNTTTASGRRRLSRIAKICCNYGQRVQNSVFECSLDPAQFETMKSELMKAADLTRDSLRFYNLGKNWKRKVEHVGAKEAYDPEGLLCV